MSTYFIERASEELCPDELHELLEEWEESQLECELSYQEYKTEQELNAFLETL